MGSTDPDPCAVASRPARAGGGRTHKPVAYARISRGLLGGGFTLQRCGVSAPFWQAGDDRPSKSIPVLAAVLLSMELLLLLLRHIWADVSGSRNWQLMVWDPLLSRGGSCGSVSCGCGM